MYSTVQDSDLTPRRGGDSAASGRQGDSESSPTGQTARASHSMHNAVRGGPGRQLP